VQVVKTEFQPHVNLTLTCQDHDGDIRISFKKDEGAHSFLGRDAQNVKAGMPTMNLGWLDDDPRDLNGGSFGVIKHELGHALCAWIHEHQIDGNGIEWNKEEVIADLQKPPNEWSHAQIETNMFNRYKRDSKETRALEYDGASIMHYAFPKKWVKNKDYTPRYNQHLSEQDIYYMRLMYPNKPMDLPRELVATDAEIDEVYDSFLERTANMGKKKKKCEPTDTQVIVIALACVALMTMLGYFVGKSRGRSSARLLA
jgi:hypothetical protein